MNVLILAAGYGTRLYPLVKDTPKPLLTIGEKPLIDYILMKFEKTDGLKMIFVVTNDKFFKSFQQWAQQIKKSPADIKVINDGTKTPEERLGSIGDILYVIQKEKIEGDLLVIGGDNLFDYSLEPYIRFAQKVAPRVTIGLYDIEDKKKAKIYGVVELDQKDRVISFEEKPISPRSSLIGMCLYYFPKASLSLVNDYLRESQRSDTAGDYINWLYQREHVYGFKFQGKWYDIGSIESYQEAQKGFLAQS